MSKKKHRDRNSNMNGYNSYGPMQRNNMRGSMNYPFGINPQQLLSMFGGNFDMNRLNGMLSSMNKDGFNFNSMNDQMNNNTYSNNNSGMNFDYNNMNNTNNTSNDNLQSTEDINIKIKNYTSKEFDDIILKAKQKKIDEENITFLMNLKEIVDDKRKLFIDNIIKTLIE